MSNYIYKNLFFSTTQRLYRKNHISFYQGFDLNNYNKFRNGGLRFKKLFKKSFKQKPLISIITVTFNCKNFINQTIKSVLKLPYDNIEYIIIDGGSTDGTLNNIKKYNNFCDFWTSKKDNGIYHAMNKGSKYATGDAIYFLNAGDILRHKHFMKLIKLYNKNNNLYGKNFVLCGTHKFTQGYPGFKLLKNNFIPSLGRLPSHQSMLIPRKLQLENLYDENYPISADKDFKLKIYLNKIKFIITDYEVCLSLPDGKSQHFENHNKLKVRSMEIYSIFCKNYNFVWALLYTSAFYIWNLRKIVKGIFINEKFDHH